MRIETQNPKSHSIRRFIFSLCVAITLVYIVGFTIHDYCSRVIQPAPNTPVHRRNRFHPRYWNDGTLTTVVDPPIHTRVIERKKRKK